MLEQNKEINQKFIDFYKAVFKDGALSVKIKELIAIGVALGGKCEPCYKLHVGKARKLGCSEDEIREAIAVSEVISAGGVRQIVWEAEEK